MSIDKAIYDFLAREENLKHVVELSEALDHFRKEMHGSFWATYNHMMSLKLATSEHSAKWEYRPFNLKRILSDWERSMFAPLGLAGDKLKIYFLFQQEAPENNFRLSYSVNWNKKSSEVKYDSPALVRLKVKLSSYKINLPGSWDFLWGFTDWRIYDASFLTRLYSVREVFCQEIVDRNWNLFLDLRPLLEEVNCEVQSLAS